MHSPQEKQLPMIFTVSDGTGETALGIVQAVKVQFENADIKIQKFNKIRSRDTMEEILLLAHEEKATVVATVVTPDLRVFLLSRALQIGVKVVDVLFPLLETLSEQLGLKPVAKPGLLRQLDNDYFKRISAIEFTVRHDDGILTQDLHQADIVLLGVSRTSKTPLSMYLAHKGYKVANIPIIPGIEPPAELTKVNQLRIIGLVIDPNRLAVIRSARMECLGEKEGNGEYADLDRIFEEIEWSRVLFKKHKLWPVLDVTGKALEENAVEIEKIVLKRFPQHTQQKNQP